ncbi:uncharacterized protein L3040_009283 [Drepanopeziza brunnea f. sp. 'multigermtubi']|uniref:uncharacterized protein n=1 Tax=Drepanopeziza brunnea f. sp. 'multigermtubi' TaxID=698441 RepID=UPI002398D486|nr:hypothetical protein L3040_009283 [Drepanopeziza brunnea f. sp. 'multigermtubi']
MRQFSRIQGSDPRAGLLIYYVPQNPGDAKAPVATKIRTNVSGNADAAAWGKTISGKENPRHERIPSSRTWRLTRDYNVYRKQHLCCRLPSGSGSGWVSPEESPTDRLATYGFTKRGFGEGIPGHSSLRDQVLTDHFWHNPLS